MNPTVIHPISLDRMASSIARTYNDAGAIVVSSGEDGIRVGVSGLDLKEAQDALCVAIYHVLSRALD